MITRTTTRWTYVPNGATTVFGFDNLVLNAADLAVTWLDGNANGLALPGYTVNGVGNPTGGNVTFNAAPAATAGSLLILERTTSAVTAGGDPQDYIQDPAATRQYNRDQAVLLGQEAWRRVKRALLLSPLEPDGPTVLPPPTLRANMALLFDNLGRLTVGAPLAAGTLVVSAFVQGIIGAANAAAFLVDLGFSTFFQTLVGAANAAAALTTLGVSNFVQGLLASASGTAFQTAIGIPTLWTVGSAINAAANIDLTATGMGITLGDQRGLVGTTAITTITGTQRLARLVAQSDGVNLTHDGVNIISRTGSSIVLRSGDAVTLANLGGNKWTEVGFDPLPNWQSATFSLAVADSHTIAHNLGKRVGAVRLCGVLNAAQTDGEWLDTDFTNGKRVVFDAQYVVSGDGASLVVDDTNAQIVTSSSGLTITQKTSRGSVLLAMAKWTFWFEIDARN